MSTHFKLFRVFALKPMIDVRFLLFVSDNNIVLRNKDVCASLCASSQCYPEGFAPPTLTPWKLFPRSLCVPCDIFPCYNVTTCGSLKRTQHFTWFAWKSHKLPLVAKGQKLCNVRKLYDKCTSHTNTYNALFLNRPPWALLCVGPHPAMQYRAFSWKFQP